MASLVAVLASLAGCSPAASPPVSTGPPPAAPTPAAPAPEKVERTGGSDGNPFPIPASRRFSPPPDLRAGGRVVLGGPEGPINNDAEKNLAFFTAPEFSQGENTGRLFFHTIQSAYPDDRSGGLSAFYVMWHPLNADGAMAQRFFAPEGYTVLEAVAKPGKLLVTHAPEPGTPHRQRTDAYLWKGDAHGKGRFVPADPAFARLVAPKDPAKQDEAALHRESAFSHFAQREYAEGIEEFKKAIAVKPDAEAYFGLGQCYEGRYLVANSKEIGLAIDAYTQALKLDPKHHRALDARARVYLFDDRFDTGIADLTRLMALQPKLDTHPITRAEAYALKGSYLMKQGQPDKAKAAYAAAIADVRTAIKLNPAEPDHWIPLCDYQYDAAHYAEAAATAKQGLAKDEAQTRPRMVLAFISARNGDLAGAQKAYAGAKANGVLTDQRREGIRQMQYALKEHPNSPAIRGLMELLVGPDELTPADW